MLWKLNRLSKLHNAMRSVYYFILGSIPMMVTYRIGKEVKKKRLPYKIIDEGSVVVQIGCPWDTVLVGRSRGMYLSLLAGRSGKVIIFEPERKSINVLQDVVKRMNTGNTTIVDKGAWSSKTRLRFLYDPKHPAANLVEDVYDARRNDLQKYMVTEVEVDTVDNVLAEMGISAVDLISITTNGSEMQILEGMKKAIVNTKYIAIIGDCDISALSESGYALVGEDDRGRTFRNEKLLRAM
jgi:FkbM family methyltransferase